MLGCGGGTGPDTELVGHWQGRWVDNSVNQQGQLNVVLIDDKDVGQVTGNVFRTQPDPAAPDDLSRDTILSTGTVQGQVRGKDLNATYTYPTGTYTASGRIVIDAAGHLVGFLKTAPVPKPADPFFAIWSGNAINTQGPPNEVNTLTLVMMADHRFSGVLLKTVNNATTRFRIQGSMQPGGAIAANVTDANGQTAQGAGSLALANVHLTGTLTVPAPLAMSLALDLSSIPDSTSYIDLVRL